MKNLVQDGKTMSYTVADKAVKSGDVVVVGDVAGVAMADGAIGDTIALYVEGVFELPKGATAIDQGKKVYVNVAAEGGAITIVGTATGNTFIGYAWSKAAASAGTVDVKLSY